MASYGKLEFYIANPATGEAVAGASIEIRKQGARTNGSTGPTSATVHTPGGISIGDDVQEGLSGETNNISSVTGTTIVTAGAGWGTIPDNTRMTPITNLPTLYEAEDGTTTKSNPLTTDSNGYAFCYLLNGVNDAVVSGAGLTTTILADVPSVGGGYFITNLFGTGSGTNAWALDTTRAFSGTDVLLSIKNLNTNKFVLRHDGRLTLSADLIATGATLSGLLTVSSGGATISAGDLTMGAAASRLIPGATSFAVRNTANSQDNLLIANAGDVTAFRDLSMRRLRPTRGTSVVVGDFALSAGWGTTATVATAAGSDTSGRISISSSGTGQTANPTVQFTFKDGAYSGVIQPLAIRTESSSPITAFWIMQAISSTTVTFLFAGTPVAGTNYGLGWTVM